jgi:hypothetical protein
MVQLGATKILLQSKKPAIYRHFLHVRKEKAADQTSYARLRLGLRALQHSTRFSLSEAVQAIIAAWAPASPV